ncbi:Outer membrane protein OmpA [Pseudomonas delhiensis]|uniref:Outer membrane protein OmpA n=1 Tax=Pseudomonas delhiensis TaxID=366289 RepID=A0A239K5Z8_9PSED|nr:OmpA family protein [Pseudomonas delhiensis]SDJ01803.1 Outer membrane protein OmpA [Pseudomonas delhiensis]SNT13112.1 Outer membrane protein OmpA [Pseudomonas delhiensis]
MTAKPLKPSRLFIGLLLSLLLAGCQTPPAPQKGLSAEQVAVLRQQGFALGEEGWELGLSSKVLFGNNLDNIDPASRGEVERIGRVLLGVGIDRLRLEGHTDSYGDAGYNQQLSVRRAQSVAQVLAGIGMPRENLEVIGRGMQRPVADNSSPAGRMENRRVSIIVPAE